LTIENKALYKAEIRSELMKKQGQLATLALTKDEAVHNQTQSGRKRENQPLVQTELMVIQSSKSNNG
jgi:hypothetical protein